MLVNLCFHTSIIEPVKHRTSVLVLFIDETWALDGDMLTTFLSTKVFPNWKLKDTFLFAYNNFSIVVGNTGKWMFCRVRWLHSCFETVSLKWRPNEQIGISGPTLSHAHVSMSLVKYGDTWWVVSKKSNLSSTWVPFSLHASKNFLCGQEPFLSQEPVSLANVALTQLNSVVFLIA